MTARQVYVDTIRTLPPGERLRLAALILDELTRTGAMPAVVDSSDVWSEQDQRDVVAFSLDYAAALYPEDEDLV